MVATSSCTPHVFQLLAVLVSHFQLAHIAEADKITGFVVDNYCWDRPNHIGIDGANLELTPENHILHCLTFSNCIPGGYAILEQYTDSEGQAKYRPRYQLDTQGNELVVELVGKEITKNGDRKFAEQVEVEGEIVDAAQNSAHRPGLTAPAPGLQILVVRRIKSVHGDTSKAVEVGVAEDTASPTAPPTATPTASQTTSPTESSTTGGTSDNTASPAASPAASPTASPTNSATVSNMTGGGASDNTNGETNSQNELSGAMHMRTLASTILAWLFFCH